ncbi:MAG: peptidylprolyl isomerase [Pirellulales bacterium]|nr:peptidylprolyl isomerase [Pirellulales bacterium]
MRAYYSPIAGLFAVAILLTFGGCGKSGTDGAPTPASIPGKDNQTSPDKVPAPQTPPEVVLDTSMGSITIRLNAEKSPKTVENFLAYVKSRFYDGTIFHQVYKNQGIIGGAYTEEMTAKPVGVPIRNEAHNRLKNERYTVAMLREPDNCDSATSAFFINAADNPAFDHTARTPEGYGYCVFGEVVQGKEIVDRIANVEVHDLENTPCTPVTPVVIKSAKKIK